MSPHATRYSWLTFRLRTVFLLMMALALFLGVFLIPRETRRQARNALIARGITSISNMIPTIRRPIE